MNKNQLIYRDCTENCRSTAHGNLITAAITKRSISDLELCSYLNYICTNCESVKDSEGRTALHMAASCGRVDLVRWLFKIKNANINLKDDESGYTPLHRSLFYGKIHVAVELMKMGANNTFYDMDSLTAIEHVTKDGHKPQECSFGSLYTWGLNNNNSLGSFNSRSIPECLDIFHKRHPETRVQQVCIDKFHSIIVTMDGEAYSCGHGLGGRLGLGTEQTVVVPTRIDFQSSEKVSILKASIARDHCLFLARDNRGDTILYSCGSNKYKVLGLSPGLEKVLTPCKIKKTFQQAVEGITTGKFHSAVWTSSELYTWGLNAGQLGQEPINGNYYVHSPKQVKVINAENSSIKQVASSDGAIAVMTAKGDIYILHEYQCRKIASKMLNVRDIAIIGGNLNTSVDRDLKNEPNKELKVVVRTNVGNLFLWQESDQQLCRCIFSIPRTIVVTQVTININEVLFVTDFGEAYRGVIKPRKKKTLVEKKNAFHNFLVREECVTLKLSKIQRIHRAIAIVSDPRGEDYCVIQRSPYNDDVFQDDPPVGQMKKQLAILLEDANEDDNIHDVRIKIGNRVFPIHRYIVAHYSNTLQILCHDNKEVVLKDVNVDLFEQMLAFMYSEECDLLRVGKCPERFRKYCSGHADAKENEEILDTIEKNGKKKKSIQNPIRMLQELSKRFGCTKLFHLLSEYDMKGFVICRKAARKDAQVVHDVTNFPEYHDVVLRCSDGKEIKAHKCILAARMEYFNSIFSVRWYGAEKTKIDVPYPSNLVDALLEFVYTDSLLVLLKKDCDFLLKLIVIADEYLMDDLKNQCARILTSAYLDLKNAVEILQFAHYYKSSNLKQGVMNYIVNNMAYFLEIQALNDLSDDILEDLSRHYFEKTEKICCRVITPYSTAVPDEIISDVNNTFPVNTEVPEAKKAASSKYPKRRTRTTRSATSETGTKKSLDKEGENLDSVIQFPDVVDTPETNNSSVQKRLSAISAAVETLEAEDCVSDFTNLNESFRMGSSSNDFPLLSSPKDVGCYGLNSPPSHGKLLSKNEGKHRMVRLSQRERKRLSSESKDAAPVIPDVSPKNPWKMIAPETSPIVSPSSGTTFCDILTSERKQKENLVKITNKLLIHTQLEDKAIVELEKFYSVDNVEDEIITVERVEIGSIASPIWVPRSQAHSSHS